MTKRRIFKFEEPLYTGRFSVFFAGEPEKTRGLITKTLGIERDAMPLDLFNSTAFYSGVVDDTRGVFWFAEKEPCASTIAHEALHAVTHIMHIVGHRLEYDTSEEPHCYLLEFIVGNIYNFSRGNK